MSKVGRPFAPGEAMGAPVHQNRVSKTKTTKRNGRDEDGREAPRTGRRTTGSSRSQSYGRAWRPWERAQRGKKAELVERLTARMAAVGAGEQAPEAREVDGDGGWGAKKQRERTQRERTQRERTQRERTQREKGRGATVTAKKRPASPRAASDKASAQLPTPRSNKKPKNDEGGSREKAGETGARE